MVLIDKRIDTLVRKLAVDKYLHVVVTAEHLVQDTGKSWERALADALENHKCLKNKPKRQNDDEDENTNQDLPN